MDLSLATSSIGSSTVVSVGGEVDVYSAPTLRDRISDVLESGDTEVVLDLADLEFIDSTGLGVLVASRNRAVDLGGSLRLVCTQNRFLKLLSITGLDDVFDVYSSVEDAVSASSSDDPSAEQA